MEEAKEGKTETKTRINLWAALTIGCAIKVESFNF
jgi:hypothetical protein